MTSVNTRLNIEKLDGNSVQNHRGVEQCGFMQLGHDVKAGVHGVHGQMVQRKLEVKQLEGKTNMDGIGGSRWMEGYAFGVCEWCVGAVFLSGGREEGYNTLFNWGFEVGSAIWGWKGGGGWSEICGGEGCGGGSGEERKLGGSGAWKVARVGNEVEGGIARRLGGNGSWVRGGRARTGGRGREFLGWKGGWEDRKREGRREEESYTIRALVGLLGGGGNFGKRWEIGGSGGGGELGSFWAKRVSGVLSWGGGGGGRKGEGMDGYGGGNWDKDIRERGKEMWRGVEGNEENGLIVVPGIANQNPNPNRNGNIVAARAEDNAIRNNGDLDKIKEVNANCILMANLQQASTSSTQTDKAPVYDSNVSFENDSNVISEVPSVEQGGGIVEQHPATVEETRAYFESLYNNLAIEVEKVNTVNRKLRETNADLTTELARYKNQGKCFEISQEKYDKLE
ncbi:hypothetical protein Tco_0386503, partial [Tanacetum coccineum]